MNKHTLTLLGSVHGELRVAASTLHETLGALIEGARLATRFVVEGESLRKGPRPSWLDAACAFDVTALSAGSAVMTLEALTLHEVDAARFGDLCQRSLFDRDQRRIGERTAVDLFAQVLAAVVEDEADDIIADRPLLDSCVRFARAAGPAFAGVQLEGLSGRDTPLVITPDQAPRIERLRDATPPPQAVRVAGTLDTISASRPDVLLKLNDGTTVPARLEDHDAQALRSLFGTPVTVSGKAHFRPSGRLLLVDVESIAPASATDRVFESAPVATRRLPVALPVAQDASSGVPAFFGTWPGEESDDDLLAALRAIG